MVPILWCDIETTGLSKDALILEVGLIATDQNLMEEDRINIVIGWPDVNAFLGECAREMHTANGLLDEVSASTISLADAEQQLITWAERFSGRPMGGSSVHTDRSWLQHSMPRLEKMFHYRNFDVSTLRAFFEASEVIKGVPHRALGDLTHDIRVTTDMRSRYLSK